MNITEYKELAALFGLSRDAVIGLQKGQIVFANPAAGEYFNLSPGDRPPDWLPDWLLSQKAAHFACTLPREEENLSASCVRMGKLLLLSIPRTAPPPSVIPAPVLTELCSSLHNLRMAAELILRRSGEETEAGAYSSVLQHSYYRLLRLSRNLSDANALLRGELPMQLQPLDLRLLCSRLIDSVRFFTRGQGAELSFASEPGHYTMRGDRARLEQLLLNLLANAYAHTEPGQAIHVSLSRRQEQLILAVDDNGSGMPAAALCSLFSVRELASLQENQAGLGLFICEGIVRGMGGSLMVQSSPGEGTHLRIMLPAADTLTLRDGADSDAGPERILTELAPVLPSEAYERRSLD